MAQNISLSDPMYRCVYPYYDCPLIAQGKPHLHWEAGIVLECKLPAPLIEQTLEICPDAVKENSWALKYVGEQIREICFLAATTILSNNLQHEHISIRHESSNHMKKCATNKLADRNSKNHKSAIKIRHTRKIFNGKYKISQPRKNNFFIKGKNKQK